MGTEIRRLVTFSSANHIGMVNEDGTGERTLEFPVPGQARWALGPMFKDGHRIIVTSYEDITISKVVLGEVTTHTWIYNLITGSLSEILVNDRLAPFMVCHSILPGEEQVAVNAFLDGEERIFTVDLYGRHQVELTHAGQGYCYGVELNTDGNRLAFHVTGSKLEKNMQPSWFRPGPYSINTIGVDGRSRALVAGEVGHLYFVQAGRRMENGWFTWIATANPIPLISGPISASDALMDRSTGQ